MAVAFDGKTALEVARAFKPQVVLCDVGLPEGMDGYTVAAAFRADPTLRDARLVALTGYGRDQDQARARTAGFDVHIRKPPDVEVLKRTVAQLMANGPQ